MENSKRFRTISVSTKNKKMKPEKATAVSKRNKNLEVKLTDLQTPTVKIDRNELWTELKHSFQKHFGPKKRSALKNSARELRQATSPLVHMGIRKVRSFGKHLSDRIRRVDYSLKNESMRFAAIFLAVTIVMIFAHFFNAAHRAIYAAYEVRVNGELVAYTKNIETFEQQVENAEYHLSADLGAHIHFDGLFEYVPTLADFDQLADDAAVYALTDRLTEGKAYGYSLRINDIYAGTVREQREVQEALQTLKRHYAIDGEEQQTDILEPTEIVFESIPLESLMTQRNLTETLLEAQEIQQFHTVEAGESFFSIAAIHDLAYPKLVAWNPGIDPSEPAVGTAVRICDPLPTVTVAASKTVEYEKPIEYETVVQQDENVYKNKRYVSIAGQNGKRKIVEKQIYHNGQIVETTVMEEQILQEAVAEIIIQGTKELPPTMATGIFQYPTRGMLTSPFGMRWGRMHTGIDLANSYGTPVVASDAGKVIYAGYKGTYGNTVEISHENGFVSRYAHLSKISVSAGQRVYKGEHIGNMGSTGNSYGNHLHFEILKNGAHQNPKNYLP